MELRTHIIWVQWSIIRVLRSDHLLGVVSRCEGRHISGFCSCLIGISGRRVYVEIIDMLEDRTDIENGLRNPGAFGYHLWIEAWGAIRDLSYYFVP